MKVDAGDFILVSGIADSSKPRLVKFLEQHGKECTGYLDKPSKDDESKTISFSSKEIVANLGRFPKAGTVFGVKVEPLRKTIQDARFGEIRIYQKFDDDQLDRLMHELKTFYSFIKDKKHHKIPYHLEIRAPQGKYQGYYKYLPKSEQDILCIKPEKSLEGLQYVLAHEHGHALWNRRFTARLRNRWIKSYHHYVALSEASADDLQQIMEEIQAMGSIRDYFKDAEEDTRAIIKACLRYVHQVHGLSKHHLECALSVQEGLDEYWPITPLDFSEKSIAITEYARKSPEEFFAEAYAFWFLNRPLPKKVDTLINDTFAKLPN